MAKKNFYIRSALFVPAANLERIPKALATDASIVIVDLEDAVEADAKFSVRHQLEKWANDNPGRRFFLRINDAQSPWFIDDLAFAGRIDKNILGVMLPKAESAKDVVPVERLGVPVIPLIETAAGVTHLKEICAVDGVTRISIGELDLALSLRIDRNTEGAKRLINHVRSQVCLHSQAAKLNPPLDTVYPNFKDLEGLENHLNFTKEMGFGGSLCIHPMQLDVIHKVFMPKPEDLEWAKRVVAAARKYGNSVFQLDGEMIDRPVIEHAEALLKETDGVVITR
ncbi:CoA ester lyase [Oligella ureolytica]|nr:CoA ester lyase [Alcaligenaceae bacterium]